MTISGFAVANKVYDSTTSATITDNGTLSGILSGDSVTLGTGSATAAFASSNVATGIAVTGSGYTISGANSGNYTLTQPSTSANITPVSVTVSETANALQGSTDGEFQVSRTGLDTGVARRVILRGGDRDLRQRLHGLERLGHYTG